MGRTVSASFLTDSDERVFDACKEISLSISKHIKSEYHDEFVKEYGKIHYTRDAGIGRGGGKLQRDAICTRGRGGKNPFSNRNLRWHPLVTAEKKSKFAKEIERIEIKGEGNSQILRFVIKENNAEKKYAPDKVHEIKERYVILPQHWLEHIDVLRNWSESLWTQNSCLIPSLEACDWEDSIKTYAILGIAIAVNFYDAKYSDLRREIVETLKNQVPSISINEDFLDNEKEIISCPVCRKEISENLNNFRFAKRETSWSPPWMPRKTKEGDDSSIQIMHVNPLVESELRHNASNVRYGHRWCNVAMTDHSLEETLNFMEFVVKAHNRM